MENVKMLYGAARKSQEERIARDALKIASARDEATIDVRTSAESFALYASIAKSIAAIFLYAIPSIVGAAVALKIVFWIVSI